MEHLQLQENNRDRILSELKNIIKQVYHEAVNHELRQENVDYITHTLVKRLDESLLHGVKNVSLGYWKIIKKILHPDSMTQISRLPGVNQSPLSKGRAWVMTSLLDDAFVSYINCFMREPGLEKVYEEWSILRNSDSSNSFLSLLSGIENVSFIFEVVDVNKPLKNCTLTPRVISPAPFWSPTPSLSDSGVQLDKSEDYLNGNITTPVILRRKSKHGDRHVSFHEDSYSRSPSQRKLKWDAENSRFSWAGEDLDILKMTGLKLTQPKFEERGTPEGQEAPQDFRSSDSKLMAPCISKVTSCRPLVPSKNKKRLSCRKIRVDWDLLARFAHDLDSEIRLFRRSQSIYELELPGKLLDMVGVSRSTKYWSYKLWGKLLILTEDRVIILHKDLCTTILTLAQVTQVVVYPHKHSFQLQTRKLTHVLTSGDQSLSQEILSRLAFNMHRARLPPVDFRILKPDDLSNVKSELVNRHILNDDSSVLYLGMVRLQLSDPPTPAEDEEKRGFIMYQTGKDSHWLPGELLLRGGIMYLFGEGKTPQMAVNLVNSCASFERTFLPDRPHSFRIVLKNPALLEEAGNCFYEDLALKTELTSPRSSMIERWTRGKFSGDAITQLVEKVGEMLRPDSSNLVSSAINIAAADECELSDWLQAILQVFCQSNEKLWETEATEASLLVTQESTALFIQPNPPLCGFRVLASALIEEITAFNVGSHPMDSYCIIELECMEVGSNTSDWILHFGSRAELERVRHLLQQQWRSPDLFPNNTVCDPRCERTQACLTREWFA